MELGDGSFVEIEWSGLLFYLNLDIYIYYIYRFFFTYGIFYRQNSRASTSISNIAKMRSSSLSH